VKYFLSKKLLNAKQVILCSLLLVLSACENAIEVPAKTETALEHARKHLDPSYVCPMHPQIVKGEPDNCPICGMQLIQQQNPVDSQDSIVTIGNRSIQNLGIRTEQVKKGNIHKQLRVLGTVAYDEKNVSEIRANSYGWVENLAIRRAGLQVKRGQLLLELYSPEYLTAQKDFLKAQKKDQSGITKKYAQRTESVAVRDYLRYLHIPDSALNEAARTGKVKHRIPIVAPQFGQLIQHNIHKHQFVEQGFLMFTVADLSSVWVEVNIPENQLQWVKRGLKATIRAPAFPDKSWAGRVNYIYPELDLTTRSLKVRLSVPNLSGELKPNMLARVIIHAQPISNVIKIPREALIVTGEREVVIVSLGDGKFQVVNVNSGLHSKGEVQIISGLKAQDTVVVSGQFLIDSEASLQAGFKRINGTSLH